MADEKAKHAKAEERAADQRQDDVVETLEAEPIQGEAVPLEAVLEERDAQIGRLRSELLYERAELENFKRRTEKRYRDSLEYAAEGLLKDLLPVLDNLERAAEHGKQGGPEGLEPLLEGLGHIIAQFQEVLGRHGADAVPSHGARFDPTVHDALAQVPGSEDGLVADTFEKGYTLKGRLLRPAKVTVTKVAPPEGDD